MARENVNQIMYGKEVIPPNQTFWNSKDYNLFLAKSFDWYNNNHKDIDKKKWLLLWAKDNDFNVSDVKSIPDTYLSTLGSMARLEQNGFIFKDNHKERMFNDVTGLIKQYNQTQINSNLKKVTVDKVGLVMTDFDNAIDNVMMGQSHSPLEITQPLSASNINELKSYYKQQLDYLLEDNFDDECENADPKSIKIHKDIIKLLSGDIKPKVLKPRIKKNIPPIKQVEKLNYMKSDTTLGIKSIKPEKIVFASKLVMFNTSNRKLTIFYANDSGFKVKGSTLLNFNEELSGCKTIRKPEDKLVEFVNAPKGRTDNIFEQIKSVKSKVTGRINGHNVLLKVFK